MTATGEQIAYSDAYARNVEARVAAVDAGDTTAVVLDRTVFYPGGGGQPADTGAIIRAADGATWPVRSARKVEGEIVHELEPAGAQPGALPAAGEVVSAEIDWPRRHLLMRTHTALHVLCGVVWRDYGAQVTGGNMEPGSGRMDFEFERMSGELVGEIEAKVNAELAAGRDVRVGVLPRDEAFAIPDIIRTATNLLPPDPNKSDLIGIAKVDRTGAVETMNSMLGAGFYSSAFGPLPFAFGDVALEYASVYRLKQPAVAAPAPIRR